MSESIPTFVISLRDSEARRRQISHRLNMLKLPYEFIDAVDARHGLPARYEQFIDRKRLVKPLRDVELGCALSHIWACRKVVERAVPYALILEDDAMPLPEVTDYLVGQHFRGADITQLCYGSTKVHRRGSNSLFGCFRSYRCATGVRVPVAAGYIVSSFGAAHIADNAVPVTREADWPTCTEQFKVRGTWRLVYPRLIEHLVSEGGSILDDYGRRERRGKKRRLLGVYVPPAPELFSALSRWKLRAPFALKRIRK